MAEQRMTENGGVIVEETVVEKPESRDPHKSVREIKEVRASDIEPYTGLRYLSKLFRFMAVILVMLLIAEVATGLYAQGSAAIPTLLGEASRLIVLAGVLWGTGDLAHLLIDVGHDVRATRILGSRIAYAAKVSPAGLSPVSRSTDRSRPTDRARTDVGFTDRPVQRQATELGDSGDKPPIP